MANYSLSTGALESIMNGATVEDPVMQVLESKKVTKSSSESDRYRVHLSDGRHSISFALLTTTVGAGPVENNSIIQIKKYVISDLNQVNKTNRKILLIVGMDVLENGSVVGKRLGNPQPLSDDSRQMRPSSTVSASTNATSTSNGASVSDGASTSTSIKPAQPSSSALNQSISDTKMISPISMLSPYHNKWVIKARVTNKSDIRKWSNSRGEGQLFSVDLIDESGEIRCTAFRDLVDKYYNFFQLDKVYYISKCQLKPANKQFNTLKNEYEMTIGNESIIEDCLNDDGIIPQVKYNFVPIDKISALDVGAFIDVIGVCKDATECDQFVSRSNKELKKREVYLVDQSKNQITLTLWGNQAQSFDKTNNPVVVIKGARVGEFGGGKNISTSLSGHMKTNPDIPECHRIKGWFDLEGKDADIKNLSQRTGVGNFQAQWMTFQEVQDAGLGRSERGDYYQVMATVILVRGENAVYKACPTPECNKKVVDLENGMYRCEKCKREYPNFKYRLLMSMNLGDWSGNQWVSLFANEAETVLGKTSQEVGLALESGSDAASNIFQAANFKQFIFKCRAKMETYNDEERLKTVVVKVDPVNFEEHNDFLAQNIEKWLS